MTIRHRYIYWPKADAMVEVIVTKDILGTMVDIDPFGEYCIPADEREALESRVRKQESGR